MFSQNSFILKTEWMTDRGAWLGMRFFAGMHVPRWHVNTTPSNTIFSHEYQHFACWLKMFFWIRVEKFMLSVRLVLEICGIKVVVSFNFALSAPHVKRRVKSREPSAAAAITSMVIFHYKDNMVHGCLTLVGILLPIKMVCILKMVPGAHKNIDKTSRVCLNLNAAKSHSEYKNILLMLNI